MMKEYIERNDLIRELEDDLANDINMYNSHIDKEIRDDKIYFACDVLASAPAADVRENIHAKWEFLIEGSGAAQWRCSNCNSLIPRELDCGEVCYKSDNVYCYKCGATMDL